MGWGGSCEDRGSEVGPFIRSMNGTCKSMAGSHWP